MSEPSRSRFALPWQAVVAATVLALTAAAMVFVLASDRDEASVSSDLGPTVTLRDAPEEQDPLEVEFTDVGGATGTIRDFVDGRPVVVNFFASWCPPCIAEMPDFQTVSEDFAGVVDFLGIAVQDRPEDASEIVERTGITYDWTRDIAGDLVAAAGVVQMPSTMFVAADGTLVEIEGGALDADRLRELIADHLGVSP